jgi:hypothetical protein
MNQLELKKKHPGGRPLKYKPEQLEALINDYFDTAIKNRKPFTITGLCLHLDTTRDLLMEYSNDH